MSLLECIAAFTDTSAGPSRLPTHSFSGRIVKACLMNSGARFLFRTVGY